jgi:lipoate---protein ligase
MKTYFVTSDFVDPYINLGYEEWMLNHLRHDEALFYLWQNQHTVVIGKNQNAYKECNVSLLKEKQGKLARRTSGGGAVYHDLGNLNFTFILPNEQYDVHKQLSVIIAALKQFDIEATFVGRNDIEVEGFKVSGNAFAKKATHQLHHGTLLFNVNMQDLSKYLNVSAIKMASKGIESVRKRVANLIDFNQKMTLDSLKSALLKSYESIYQTQCVPLEMNISQCQDIIDKHQSDKWQINPIPNFEAQLHEKYSWGEVQAFFDVHHGIIKNTQLFSDALDSTFISFLTQAIKGVNYDKSSWASAISSLSDDHQVMATDIMNTLFKEQS